MTTTSPHLRAASLVASSVDTGSGTCGLSAQDAGFLLHPPFQRLQSRSGTLHANHAKRAVPQAVPMPRTTDPQMQAVAVALQSATDAHILTATAALRAATAHTRDDEIFQGRAALQHIKGYGVSRAVLDGVGGQGSSRGSFGQKPIPMRQQSVVSSASNESLLQHGGIHALPAHVSAVGSLQQALQSSVIGHVFEPVFHAPAAPASGSTLRFGQPGELTSLRHCPAESPPRDKAPAGTSAGRPSQPSVPSSIIGWTVESSPRAEATLLPCAASAAVLHSPGPHHAHRMQTLTDASWPKPSLCHVSRGLPDKWPPQQLACGLEAEHPLNCSAGIAPLCHPPPKQPRDVSDRKATALPHSSTPSAKTSTTGPAYEANLLSPHRQHASPSPCQPSSSSVAQSEPVCGWLSGASSRQREQQPEVQPDTLRALQLSPGLVMETSTAVQASAFITLAMEDTPSPEIAVEARLKEMLEEILLDARAAAQQQAAETLKEIMLDARAAGEQQAAEIFKADILQAQTELAEVVSEQGQALVALRQGHEASQAETSLQLSGLVERYEEELSELRLNHLADMEELLANRPPALDAHHAHDRGASATVEDASAHLHQVQEMVATGPIRNTEIMSVVDSSAGMATEVSVCNEIQFQQLLHCRNIERKEQEWRRRDISTTPAEICAHLLKRQESHDERCFRHAQLGILRTATVVEVSPHSTQQFQELFNENLSACDTSNTNLRLVGTMVSEELLAQARCQRQEFPTESSAAQEEQQAQLSSASISLSRSTNVDRQHQCQELLSKGKPREEQVTALQGLLFAAATHASSSHQRQIEELLAKAPARERLMVAEEALARHRLLAEELLARKPPQWRRRPDRAFADSEEQHKQLKDADNAASVEVHSHHQHQSQEMLSQALAKAEKHAKLIGVSGTPAEKSDGCPEKHCHQQHVASPANLDEQHALLKNIGDKLIEDVPPHQDLHSSGSTVDVEHHALSISLLASEASDMPAHLQPEDLLAKECAQVGELLARELAGDEQHAQVSALTSKVADHEQQTQVLPVLRKDTPGEQCLQLSGLDAALSAEAPCHRQPQCQNLLIGKPTAWKDPCAQLSQSSVAATTAASSHQQYLGLDSIAQGGACGEHYNSEPKGDSVVAAVEVDGHKEVECRVMLAASMDHTAHELWLENRPGLRAIAEDLWGTGHKKLDHKYEKDSVSHTVSEGFNTAIGAASSSPKGRSAPLFEDVSPIDGSAASFEDMSDSADEQAEVPVERSSAEASRNDEPHPVDRQEEHEQDRNRAEGPKLLSATIAASEHSNPQNRSLACRGGHSRRQASEDEPVVIDSFTEIQVIHKNESPRQRKSPQKQAAVTHLAAVREGASQKASRCGAQPQKLVCHHCAVQQSDEEPVFRLISADITGAAGQLQQASPTPKEAMQNEHTDEEQSNDEAVFDLKSEDFAGAAEHLIQAASHLKDSEWPQPGHYVTSELVLADHSASGSSKPELASPAGSEDDSSDVPFESPLQAIGPRGGHAAWRPGVGRWPNPRQQYPRRQRCAQRRVTPSSEAD